LNQKTIFSNPFQPGAGHPPPYLAGRESEKEEFKKLLQQETVLKNVILTGLRGLGKTVLLNEFKAIALGDGWLWAGTNLSKSASVKEETLVTRLLADLSIVTSNFTAKKERLTNLGFAGQIEQFDVPIDYKLLKKIYDETPGLVYDKIQAVLEFVWECLRGSNKKGLVIAYDEAQTLTDHPKKDEYPLSILLDVFQSIQIKGIPFMLVLTGLPTLFPKLVETRTFSERMFHIITLDKLKEADSRDAIVIPTQKEGCPIKLDEASVSKVIETSSGYPYFIQFICREVYDVFLQQAAAGEITTVPIAAIIQKLDTDFFAGRWAKATDRQRELLTFVAYLETGGSEFTLQEVSSASKNAPGKAFSTSHVSQMFNALIQAGLIYRNRYGKYSFAVPLLDEFIKRQSAFY